jgi:hypothetical protein
MGIDGIDSLKPGDLAPDADEPGDNELSPEIADMVTIQKTQPDEVDEKPDAPIEVTE